MEQNNIAAWFFDFKKSQEALVRLGFTAEEAENQTNDLLEIITLSIAKRISQEVFDNNRVDFAEIVAMLEKKSHDPEVTKIIQEESTRILEDYFAEITKKYS